MKTPSEFFIPQIKGRIASYVAKESESAKKLVRYLRTMMDKYEISEEKMRQIFKEVKAESVDPFLKQGDVSYQPIRLKRFRELYREIFIRNEKYGQAAS